MSDQTSLGSAVLPDKLRGSFFTRDPHQPNSVWAIKLISRIPHDACALTHDMADGDLGGCHRPRESQGSWLSCSDRCSLSSESILKTRKRSWCLATMHLENQPIYLAPFFPHQPRTMYLFKEPIIVRDTHLQVLRLTT